MIPLDKRDNAIAKKIASLRYVAQVDESGVGCLAGDLIVAAVILDKENPIDGLNDSKKLSEGKRIKLYDEIIAKALDFCIVHITPKQIDDSNILAMRMYGMKKAIAGLQYVEHALIDGNKIPNGLTIPADYIIKGDAKFSGIAAASILAKVIKNKEMIEKSKYYPQYAFHQHKGYPTLLHKSMLEKYGPCAIHRMSYRPVQLSLCEKA